MTVVYPVLIGELARRGIKKNTIAKHICISERALYNKLSGNVSFTCDEAIAIKDFFFPDMDPQQLFAQADQQDSA